MKLAAAATKPDKPDGSDLRRAFRQKLRHLCRLTKRSPGQKKVHLLRKGIVQLRSWLRLVREEIGDRRFRRHNRRLRQAARQLAPARDARVMWMAFKALGSPARFPHTAQWLQGQIRRTKPKLPPALRRVKKLLQAELDKSSRLPVKEITNARFALALERMHRETEAAFAAACTLRDIRTLHTWRKRLKNELHALAIVTGVETPPARIPRQLGEDHDLALLAEALNARTDGPEKRTLLRLIATRRARLRSQFLPRPSRQRRQTS